MHRATGVVGRQSRVRQIWSGTGLLGYFAASTLSLAAGLFLGYSDHRPSTWLPSLTINLFTLGLGTLVINVIVARYERRTEHRENDRLQKEEERKREEAGDAARALAKRRSDIANFILWNLTFQQINFMCEALKESPGEWLRQMRKSSPAVLRSARHFRQNVTLFHETMSFEALVHLSEAVWIMETMAERTWTPSLNSRGMFKLNVQMVLGGVKSMAELTDNAELLKRIGEVEDTLGEKALQFGPRGFGFDDEVDPSTHP